jgi:hypothetical protein
MRVIELVRKMFKGKVIATYPSAEASLSQSSTPQYRASSLSSSAADASEYLDTEQTEEFEDGDEDDL